MSFKFEQDTSSLEKALRLGLALEPSALGVDIPLFFAEGLEVRYPCLRAVKLSGVFMEHIELLDKSSSIYFNIGSASTRNLFTIEAVTSNVLLLAMLVLVLLLPIQTWPQQKVVCPQH